MNKLALVLGNQLFKPSLLPFDKQIPIFMCESDDLCTHFKYHALKITFFLTAMREYADELKAAGRSCFYHPLKEEAQQDFFDVLAAFCQTHQVQQIECIEIEDHFFEKKLLRFVDEHNLKLIQHASPMFLCSRQQFQDYLAKTKKPFMKTFYEGQRKELGILMEGNKPLGGQFSFDEDNRKRTPKKIIFPQVKTGTQSTYLAEVQMLVQKKFATHPGQGEKVWFPITHTEVWAWFETFIEERFQLFGDYEDAIDNRSDFLYHSALSMFINVGLITPTEILERIEGLEAIIPLNSLEGFIRQIIGWREFIRGIYHHFDETQQTTNFFNHQAKLSSHWYTGNTGIVPLDTAIQQTLKLGYTHHINRLMVIGNMMLMCRIHPQEVYRWFMELYIDSADWVMGPNVFGMSQFSDGGIFATKPYLCGSNYIKKMSHYSAGPWCEKMDALYWMFIYDNQALFAKNYRMRMMVSKVNSFDETKLKQFQGIKDTVLAEITG